MIHHGTLLLRPQVVVAHGMIPQALRHVAQAGMTVLQAQVHQAGVAQAVIQAQAGVQATQAQVQVLIGKI